MKGKKSETAGKRPLKKGSHEQNFKDIQEVIQQKAYYLYLERGGTNGNELEDWLTAERTVLQTTH